MHFGDTYFKCVEIPQPKCCVLHQKNNFPILDLLGLIHAIANKHKACGESDANG